MSSAAESPDRGMALQSHYSLRWNNHQAHILHAFEALLHAEILVDVTLVCAETSLRAHKVVLSVCSPFFERIFAEHPCKHPVIVLKDFTAREISALIDFMYRGEVRVGRDDLPNLIRAAESLQIRGLVASEPRPASPPETPTTDLLGASPTPESAQLENQPRPLHDEELLADDNEAPLLSQRNSSSPLGRDRLPHMSHLNFSLRELREICASPLMPRRKQARPRRRSGELVPQDLRRPAPSLSPSAAGANPSSGHNSSNNSSQLDQSQQSPGQSQQREQQDQQQQQPQEPQQEDVAESLSMKKEPKRSQSPSVASSADHVVKSESEAASSPRASPLTGGSLHPDGSFSDLPSAGLAALSLTPPHHHSSSEYLASLGQFAAQWLPPSHQNHLSAGGASSQQRHPRDDSPHGKPPGYPFQQAESPLAPRSAFALDGMNPLGGGLFPHGGPLELHDSFKPDSFHNLFVGASLGHHHSPKKSKKHRNDGQPRRWSDHSRGLPICRPKGQHSAPRGGPPRSWTNADLTEALTMVWNKKMTTSQASRVYGIPYNSLLMYVRGKYGKSLKLEQLRRDCAAGEVMNSLNNNVKAIEPPPSPRLAGLPALPAPHQPEPEAAAAANFAHHQLMAGGLGQGFFPDFNSFPMPVGMVHLLPPSEQKAFEPPTNPQPGQNSASNGLGSQQQQQQQQPIRADDAMLSSSAGKSRSPSPMNASGAASLQCADGLMPPPAQSAPALLQQNGSD